MVVMMRMRVPCTFWIQTVHNTYMATSSRENNKVLHVFENIPKHYIHYILLLGSCPGVCLICLFSSDGFKPQGQI